jgi:hypothetical protein
MVKKATMFQKTKEIRAHCMRAKEYERVVERLCRYIHETTNFRGKKTWKIKNHLKLYGDS